MKKKLLLLFTLIALAFCAIGGVVAIAGENTEDNYPSFSPGYRNEFYSVKESYASSKVWIYDNSGENIGGYTNLIAKNDNTSALKKARSLLCTVEHKDDTVTLVLNGNSTVETKFDNEGQIMGNVVIDLNGYTVDATAVTMINAQAKISDKSVYDSKITYKNGHIIVGDAGLFSCGIYGSTYDSENAEGKYKTMRYEFDNVKISFAEGAECRSLVSGYLDNSTVGRVSQEAYKAAEAAGTLESECPAAHMQYMGLDVSINSNCVLDLTNAPAGFILFDAFDDDISDAKNTCTATINGVSTQCYYFKSNCIASFRINGGKIILGKNDIEWQRVNVENGSYVRFCKDEEGNYTRFSIPKGSKVSTDEIFDSDSGKMVLVRSDADGAYKMISKELHDSMESITFSPKVSLTLDSSLIFNVYIPASEELNRFVFEGKEYNGEADFAELEKKEISGKEYYLIKTPIDAKEAQKEFKLYVNIDAGTFSASKTYTLSIPKYASIIMSSDVSGNEKVLVADILSYIRAAYAYFDKTDRGAIDSILDADYERMSKFAPEGEAHENACSLIKSVTFSLDSKPSMRFYLNTGADVSRLKFFVNGNEADTVYNADGGYVETDVYAYQLCETVSYTCDGEYAGRYHIGNYFEYAEKLGDGELVTLVERFWKYLQSARAYREEFIGNTEYAHTHSYLEREFEMSAYTPAYSEMVCACGDNQITQHTGIEFGDKAVSVYFLGNSYTNYNDLFEMFKFIATSMDLKVDTVRRTKGSWHLWKFANPNDEGGKTFYEDIAAYDFDYAFIQDGSTQTLAAIAEFYDGVRRVGEVLEKDGTQVLLYQTWGRKAGHAILDQYGLDTGSMARTVAAAYEAIAKETGYTNSPAGSAFLDVYVNHPEIELYDPDLTHPSAAGSYLAALCHYATLFGRSPIGVKYTAGIDAETALILQTAAHNAVYGESIVTDEYKTSSEGIHVTVANNNLYEIPEGSELISVGIVGDNGKTAYSATVAKDASLTDEQKLEFSNIAYGVSVIGNKNMVTSLTRAANGAWVSNASNRLSFDFDGNRYDISGDVDMHEPYKALITYNFGGIVNITAIGYMSGNMDGFAQCQDVYVSNDGITWSIVKSASYDAVLLGKENGSLHSLGTLPIDKNGKTPGVCVVFDMNSAEGGVWAKYVRFGIKEGVVVESKSYDLNTLELAVWGKGSNVNITELPEGSENLTTGLTASKEYSATVDGALAELTEAQRADIADMSKYGMTLIGAKTLERSVQVACDGVWSGTKRLTVLFYDEGDDVKRYSVDGKESPDGKYECLITYNFGEKVTLDAIGYMSGSMDGFAQCQDVYVSNDGENWIKIVTACYDRTSGDVLSSVSNKPADSAGKTSSQCVMFDMGGIKAQYVRVAIVDGMSDSAYPTKDMNTFELAVYGKKK